MVVNGRLTSERLEEVGGDQLEVVVPFDVVVERVGLGDVLSVVLVEVLVVVVVVVVVVSSS